MPVGSPTPSELRSQQALVGSPDTDIASDSELGALAVDLAVLLGDPTMQPLATGEETLPRVLAGLSTIMLTSGTLQLTYRRARKTETVASLRTVTRGTAGAGLTVARMGLYAEDADGDLTLIAATAHDAALWGSTFTRYSRTVTSNPVKTAGERYALAVLAVGTTMPGLYGLNAAITTAEVDDAPRIAGQVADQSDLPASIASASIVSSATGSVYGVIVP